MATLNPLERKARSSFIKGILLSAVIGIIAVGILGMMLYQKNAEEYKRLNAQKTVLVLTKSVVSGQIIDSSMVKAIKADKQLIPGTSAASFDNLTTDAFDSNNNKITKEEDGRVFLHIKAEDDAATENIDEGAHQLFIDSNGDYFYELASTSIYGTNIKVTMAEDEAGNQVKYINIQNNEIVLNEVNNVYYANINNQQIPVTTNDVSITLSDTVYVAKIDLAAQTILTKDMIATAGSATTDDLRETELNMLVLPSDLNENDTIDIRLRLPSGLDYIVVSKKIVTIPMLNDGFSSTAVKVNLNEGETVTMSSAIVDSYRMQGSKLYAVKYTEPGLQERAIPTYAPSQETLELIRSNPNIVTTAKNALINRYNANYNANRQNIQNSINNVEITTQDSNVQAGATQEGTTSSTERQQYLQTVSSSGD